MCQTGRKYQGSCLVPDAWQADAVVRSMLQACSRNSGARKDSMVCRPLKLHSVCMQADAMTTTELDTFRHYVKQQLAETEEELGHAIMYNFSGAAATADDGVSDSDSNIFLCLFLF